MKYLSVEAKSKEWNLSARSVRNYCNQGRIPGAVLNGKAWMIPEEAAKPSATYSVGNKTLLSWLKEEKELRIPGRIYHYLQVEMTYNSNHIEGSKLTEDQTRQIFETKTILVGAKNESINIDDVVETINHFRCIDYVIDNAKNQLNEKFIKKLHYLLKQNTSDSYKSWFRVGEYKLLENSVGGVDTAKPEEVQNKIAKLLNEYNSKNKITVEDIVDFHYKFERIHPFQDGNGRVGRLIMLKECLKHNIVPIIIKDDFKDFYYRGLKEYSKEKGYLIDTCKHGQDILCDKLDYFKIKH